MKVIIVCLIKIVFDNWKKLNPEHNLKKKKKKKRKVKKSHSDFQSRSIEHFRKNILKTKIRNNEHYIILRTEDDNVAILPVNKIIDEEEEMQNVYKYKPTEYNLNEKLSDIIKNK